MRTNHWPSHQRSNFQWRLAELLRCCLWHFCAVGCGVGGVVWLAASSDVLAAPPNVVLIIADDQSHQDFGFLGNELVHTPNLDHLASESARFPNGYVPMSVCRPSLATLLTGLYPHQHGIHFNHPPPGLKAMRRLSALEYQKTRATTDYLIRDVPTLPRILARQGYVCLQTGKHWEGSYRTAGFTHGMTLGRPPKAEDPQSLDPVTTGTRAQANGQLVAHGNGDAGLAIGRRTMAPVADFLRDHAGRRPFFIWYAPFLPHTPFDAPTRFRNLYRDKEVPEHLLAYYAEIARFDETVGRLLELLASSGQSENTLVVFVSDNGYRPAEPGSDRKGGSKWSPNEDGLRTPILIRWPKRVKPATHRQLVQTVDLAPTILSAIGLPNKVTPRMTGIDLMPAARGESSLPERSAFGAIYPNDAHDLGKPSQHVLARWVRQGDYKLVAPGVAKGSLPRMLFNLNNDPQERVNLADSPEHRQKAVQLQAELDQWWDGATNNRVTPKRKK